jgi:hypothetical protein
MKPWPSPCISSIESDRSDTARTVVHHAMSELAHSEIPVHCEIAAITIQFAGCSGFVTPAHSTPLELDLLAKPRQKRQRTPHHTERGSATGPIGRGDEAFGKAKRDCLVRIEPLTSM